MLNSCIGGHYLGGLNSTWGDVGGRGRTWEDLFLDQGNGGMEGGGEHGGGVGGKGVAIKEAREVGEKNVSKRAARESDKGGRGEGAEPERERGIVQRQGGVGKECNNRAPSMPAPAPSLPAPLPACILHACTLPACTHIAFLWHYFSHFFPLQRASRQLGHSLDKARRRIGQGEGKTRQGLRDHVY
jgi:hypothetical protein